MKKIFKQLLILFCLVILLILPYFVFAKTTPTLDNLKNVASGPEGAYSPDTNVFSMSVFIGQVVSVFLGLLGIIFIVLMLYGGYNYMIARGEEERVNKAIDTIRRAVVGLIIVMASYATWALIYNNFIT